MTSLGVSAIRRLIAVALCASLATTLLADAADDQFRVAATLYQRGDWATATTEFRKFLAEHTDHAKSPQARFYLAEALLQEKKWPEARLAFQESVERDPEGPNAAQARFRLGESAYLSGDPAAAQAALQTFLVQAPEHKLAAQAQAYLGEIALAAKRFEEASQSFAKALQGLKPGAAHDRCQFGLALAHEQQGNLDEAVAGYRKLTVKRDGSLADDAQLGWGRIEYRRNQYAESAKLLAAFDKTYADSPLRPSAELIHGWSLFRRQKFAEAEKRFTAALKDASRASEANHWLGMSQLAQRKWKPAAESLAAAVGAARQGDPLLPESLYYQGRALAGGSEGDAARQAYERVVGDFADSPWADDAAFALVEQSDKQSTEAQETAARDFLQRYPESTFRPKVVRRLARAHLSREQFDEARQALEPLLATDDDADALATRYLLAHAYQGLKRHADALETVQPLAHQSQHALHGASGLLRAAALSSLGRHEEAVPLLEAYLKKPPADGDPASAQALLAVGLLKLGKIEKSRAAWTKFLGSKPPSALRASTERSMAEAATEQRQFDWAAELFAQVADEEKNDALAPAALSGRAWAQYQAGELEPALQTYKSIWERFPDHELAPAALLAAARIRARRQEFDTALALYQQILERPSAAPQTRDALWEAADICDDLDQDEQAEKHLARLDAEYRDHLDHDAVLYQWSWVLRQLEQPQRAAALLERLREEHPQSKFAPDAAYRLAEQAVADGHPDDAKKLLEALRAGAVPAEIEPHALWLEGKIAASEKRWDDCARAMQELARKHPDSPLKLLADYHQAEARYRLNQWSEAGLLFDDLSQRTLGRDDDWVAMVQLRRAQLKARSEDWPAAQEMAEGIAKRFPSFSQLYEADLLIGRALAKQARLTDARASYEKVLGSPSGGKTETAAMAQLFIAETYFHQEDFEAALREYLRLEILYPYPTWQSAALLQAGKCQENLERWSDAAATYARIVQQYPDSAVRREADNRLQVVRDRTARASAQAAAPPIE